MKYSYRDFEDDSQPFVAAVEEPETESKSSFSFALGLILVTMALVVIGLTMLYSASSGEVLKAGALFRNQLIWCVAGAIAGSVAFLFGYRFLAKNSCLWIAGVSVLLIWAALSRPINGARRWIHLGGYTFQPSEIAKIVAALFVAWYCSEFLRTFNHIRSRRGILQLGLGAGALMLLVMAGQDLGTTLLIGAVVFFTAIVAGLKWYYYISALIFPPLLVMYIKYFDPMRWLRLTVFLNPEQYKNDSGYQLWTSIMALGSGGWTGVGLMKSRLKAKYLPEAHTDFILAITGEELGFAGICAVLLLYCLWGYFAIRIILRARDRLGTLTGTALMFGIMLQALINIGAMSGCFPTKGMPAPFLSYGGSNLLGCLIATGILLSVAAEQDMPGYNRNILKNLKALFRGGYMSEKE